MEPAVQRIGWGVIDDDSLLLGELILHRLSLGSLDIRGRWPNPLG